LCLRCGGRGGGGETVGNGHRKIEDEVS
jgi:hypothetical protein